MPDLTPMTRQEKFLNGDTDLEPITRREYFYAGRESELPEGHQEPETREEWFIKEFREAGDVTVEEITITENGTTTAPSGKAYSPIHVNVPLPSNAYLLKSVTTPTPIASFSDGEEMVIPTLKVAIEPQQDLHGYDSPWVGGAGKNKFAGSYYNNYMSENNGVFTNIESDTQSFFRFIVQAFNDSDLIASSSQEVISSPGRYYVSITIPSSVTSLKIKHNGSSKDIGINCQFTATGTFTISLNVTKTNPSIVGGLEFKDVQIESGSQMTSYAPYSNICPISGHTEANVTRTGKNLFNSELSQGGIYPDSGNNYSSNIYVRTDFIPLKKGTYTISQNIQNAIRFYDKNKIYNRSKGIETFRTANTITLEDDSYIKIVFRASDSSNITPSSVSDIQLEVGNQATAYEPYNGHTYTIALGDTYYGGYIDWTNNNLIVDRLRIKTSDLNWVYQTTGERFYTPDLIDTIVKPIDNTRIVNGFACEYLKISSVNDVFTYGNAIGVASSGNIFLKNTDWDTTEELLGAVGDRYIVYPLATPITIPLQLPQIKSLRGVNNAYANTGDIKDAEYFSKEV